MGLGKDQKTTSTMSLDPHTQEYVDYMRGGAQDAARIAQNSGPWAQGTGEMYRRGVANLNSAAGLGADMRGISLDMLGGAMPGAMQTGFGNLAQAYGNDYASQMINSALPAYMQNRALAGQSANQLATQQGAFGGDRSAVYQAEMQGNLDRNFLGFANQAAAQGTQMGAQAMMQDRQRLAGMTGMGLNSISNQQQFMQNLANQYGSFDAINRAVQQQQAMDPFTRAQAGQGVVNASIGPYGTTQTDVTQGNLFKDVAGLGLTVAGAFMGNPGAAAGGLGMMGSSSIQNSPIMQPGADIYNYGGGYGGMQYGGLGGLGGGGLGPMQPTQMSELFQNGGWF
jgi:hypothetical protein